MKKKNLLRTYIGRVFVRPVFVLDIVLLFLFCLLIVDCSKNPMNPTDPPDVVLPDTVVVVDTVFVHEHHDHVVKVICDSVDITIGFIATIDQSQPQVYLAEVAGFPDETITLTETRPAPTDTTIVRTYEGFTGGRVSFRKTSGSRAEAVGFIILEQKCSE